MDDSLEKPTSVVTEEQRKATDNDEQESGDEADDGGLDWTTLFNRPSIPKRGEKQFEPGLGLGTETSLQQTVLQRARDAMFATLQATRARESKSLAYAIWYPSLSRAHVTIAKGVMFGNIGHSAPRPVTIDGQIKQHKRMELLPEEAIYLIERASLLCWKDVPSSLEILPGAPMSVQQAYSEMIGKENLTLEKFQVYAYLKRLGYSVTRTVPPNELYPRAAPFPRALQPPRSILQRLWDKFLSLISSFCWKPLAKSNAALFRSLRSIMPAPTIKLPPAPKDTPYKPFWNVYKPPTPFQKSSPGPPDYQIIVVNARTTRMPSLRELIDLFDVYPEVPLPVSKKKHANVKKGPDPAPTVQLSVFQRFYNYLLSKNDVVLGQRGNPFPHLRAGRKMVIVAAVDSGSISFYRFSEGVFSDWPLQ